MSYLTNNARDTLGEILLFRLTGQWGYDKKFRRVHHTLIDHKIMCAKEISVS